MTDTKKRRKLRQLRGFAYSQVVEVQTQHKSLDALHDIGTDQSCDVCKPFNNLHYLLSDLSDQLEDKDAERDTSRKVGFYIVTPSEDDVLIVAAHSKYSVERKYSNALVTLVPRKSRDAILFRTNNGQMHSLDSCSTKKTGIIAKKGLYQDSIIWLKYYSDK